MNESLHALARILKLFNMSLNNSNCMWILRTGASKIEIGPATASSRVTPVLADRGAQSVYAFSPYNAIINIYTSKSLFSRSQTLI